MGVLDTIKRTIESIESCKKQKMHEDDEMQKIFDKYSEIPRDTLESLINDVKECCMSKDTMTEEDNTVKVKNTENVTPDDVKRTNANKAESCQKNELDASESDEDEDEDNDDIEENDFDDANESDDEDDEDDENIDDELIISEEDDRDDFYTEDEDEDDDFEETEDELDIAESDEDDDDTEEDGKADRDIMKEDNSGAKAAIANKDNKGAFSSDVDALTEYLNDY